MQLSDPSDKKLTHFSEDGSAIMVDVGGKEITVREAVASAVVSMRPDTLDTIIRGEAKKGDVIGVARIAGIMSAKRTSDLIPLAHPLPLTSVTIDFSPDYDQSLLRIQSTVKVVAKTGVEMEALTAVSVAGLTIYDMCKAIDRTMTISQIKLMEKSGGRSGHFKRDSHE